MLLFFFFSFPAGLLTLLLQVLPLAAARYSDFAKDDTPFPVVILADGLYLSSGFLNVLLYRYTRPYLLPYRMDSVDDSVDNQSIMLNTEKASPVRDEEYIRDESTQAGASRTDDDI
jgi:hypothetical protein